METNTVALDFVRIGRRSQIHVICRCVSGAGLGGDGAERERERERKAQNEYA
jgi:hypothetical protein